MFYINMLKYAALSVFNPRDKPLTYSCLLSFAITSFSTEFPKKCDIFQYADIVTLLLMLFLFIS